MPSTVVQCLRTYSVGKVKFDGCSPVNAGKRDIKEDRKGNRPYDGWTIVTRDRSLSAQWEHTVLVTETGYEVLTVSAGSPGAPAFALAGYGSAALQSAAGPPLSLAG